MCNMIPTCVGDLLAFFENASLPPQGRTSCISPFKTGPPKPWLKKNNSTKLSGSNKGELGNMNGGRGARCIQMEHVRVIFFER